MSDVQTGHEHDQPRGAVLSLSTPMIETLSPDDRSALVGILAGLSESGLGEADMADQLTESLDRLGVPQPGPVVSRLVENLRGARELTIVTDSGEVLYGDSGFAVSRQDANVHGDEDPESSNRPVYS